MQYIKIIESWYGVGIFVIFYPRNVPKKISENFVWDTHIEVVSDT